MLSEARARLANTQGKKAKRKARERQLEEARRLAVLQKKRELKAAGIIMRHKTKKKGMDYNADIPFEKKAAPGFYDTSDEQARATVAPVGQTLRRLENKRKPEEEEAERKKRQRRGKDGEQGGPHQTKFVAARDAQIQKLKEAESIGRRQKLVLPAAQVGETELEEIVKIGQASENAKALVGGGSDASGRLLSDYEGLEKARMARTPRTEQQRAYWFSFHQSTGLTSRAEDNVLMEARNLRNMTVAQTPLLGEENTPLHSGLPGGTGFDSATPRHQVAITPNPLATPLHGANGFDVGATPRVDSVGATPLRTPLRDGLSINADGSTFVPATPRDQRLRESAAKRALKAGFLNLPQPENNFELLVPEDEDEEEATGVILSQEDAEERDARLKRQREEEERKALARRSQAVQRGLPRPPVVNLEALMQNLSVDDEVDEHSSARRLVDAELAALLQHDAIAHPLPGTSLPGSTESAYELPEDDFVADAKSQVQRELATVFGMPGALEEDVRAKITSAASWDDVDSSLSWASIRPALAFDSSSGRWVDKANLSPEARAAGYAAVLGESREGMSREASKATKMEKKLGVTLGGYQARSTALTKKITEAFGALQAASVDHASFVRLQVNEGAAGPARSTALREEVEKIERRARALQEKYAELDAERREAEARVAAAEEKVMLEAEALNEVALAEMDAVVETTA